MRANGWSRTTAHLNIPTFDTIGFIRCLAPSCSSRWQVGKAAFPCGLAIRIQKISIVSLDNASRHFLILVVIITMSNIID